MKPTAPVRDMGSSGTTTRRRPTLFLKSCIKALSTLSYLAATATSIGAELTFSRIDSAFPTLGSRTFASAAWGDFDGDGRPDLYLCGLESGTGELYRNSPAGFTRVDAGAVATDVAGRGGAVWGDFDNDGNLDLFAASIGSPRDLLYRNLGNGTFAAIRGIPDQEAYHRQSTINADFDSDGRLDLFVANGSGGGAQRNFVFRNRGDFGFERLVEGEVTTEARPSNGSSFADYDGDGDLDLLITDALNPNSLFRNEGGGVFFRTTSGDLGEAIQPQGGNAAAWGDFDNDGDLDLLVPTGLGKNILHRNEGGELLRITHAPVTDPVAASFASAWADFDNDGWLDLLVSQRNGPQLLYRGTGEGNFAAVTSTHLSGIQAANGLAIADVDLDGDLDIWIGSWTGGPAPTLLRNTTSGNHWLRIRLVGTASNHSGVGAKIRVKATIGGETVWQLRQVGGFDSAASHELIAHFGLGASAQAEMVRIEWPSGRTQELTAVAADQLVVATEPPPAPLSIVPNGGLFTNSVTVKLESNVPGAEIRYTVDGGDPSPSTLLYTQPVVLSLSSTIKARLYLNGFPASEIQTAVFTADPGLRFEPSGGLFTNKLSVTLVSRLADVVIRYSQDGTDPGIGSTAYEQPLLISSAAIFRARAFFNGFPVTDVIVGQFDRVYTFDNDGISTPWREQFFGAGYKTNSMAAADADPDADGSSNLQEFVAGTNPVDPISGFTVGVRAVPEIRFPSVIGQKYRILRKSSLTGEFLTAVEIVATAEVTRYVDIEAGTIASPAFYLVAPAP